MCVAGTGTGTSCPSMSMAGAAETQQRLTVIVIHQMIAPTQRQALWEKCLNSFGDEEAEVLTMPGFTLEVALALCPQGRMPECG